MWFPMGSLTWLNVKLAFSHAWSTDMELTRVFMKDARFPGVKRGGGNTREIVIECEF